MADLLKHDDESTLAIQNLERQLNQIPLEYDRIQDRISKELDAESENQRAQSVLQEKLFQSPQIDQMSRSDVEEYLLKHIPDLKQSAIDLQSQMRSNRQFVQHKQDPEYLTEIIARIDELGSTAKQHMYNLNQKEQNERRVREFQRQTEVIREQLRLRLGLAEKISQKYREQTPINMDEVVDDQQKVPDLVSQLDNTAEQVRLVIDSLYGNADMPSEELNATLKELQKLLVDIEMERKTLTNVQPVIQDVIDTKLKLQKELNDLTQDIDKLEKTRPAPTDDLALLREHENQILLIDERLQQLQQQVANQKSDDPENFIAIKSRLEALQKDADLTRHDRLSGIGNDIQKELADIQQLLQQATDVQQDPHAQIVDLQRAKDMVESAKPKLQNVEYLRLQLGDDGDVEGKFFCNQRCSSPFLEKCTEIERSQRSWFRSPEHLWL